MKELRDLGREFPDLRIRRLGFKLHLLHLLTGEILSKCSKGLLLHPPKENKNVYLSWFRIGDMKKICIISHTFYRNTLKIVTHKKHYKVAHVRGRERMKSGDKRELKVQEQLHMFP